MNELIESNKIDVTNEIGEAFELILNGINKLIEAVAEFIRYFIKMIVEYIENIFYFRYIRDRRISLLNSQFKKRRNKYVTQQRRISSDYRL